MSEWRWYCMRCHADMGPMVGKHYGKCPECGSKSAYATKRGTVDAIVRERQYRERMRERGE